MNGYYKLDETLNLSVPQIASVTRYEPLYQEDHPPGEHLYEEPLAEPDDQPLEDWLWHQQVQSRQEYWELQFEEF
jgi:hypothetical protein